MDKYRSINYNYNSRTKRYTLVTNKSLEVFNVISKLLGKSSASAMIVKLTKNSFDIYEFFLLELEFLLRELKDSRPDLGMLLGGPFINDLLGFIRKRSWVSDRYNKKSIDVLNSGNIIRYMKYKPLQHQMLSYEKYEEVKRMGNLRGYMLDAEAGVGKTYMSLSLGEALEYNYFIILAPKATLDEVWVKSVTESLFKTPQSVIKLNAKDNVYGGEKFIVTHYEYLNKLLEDKKLVRKLKRLKPMLIVDEFHNFNEITSMRTEKLLEFVKYMKLEDIVLLTGTPIKMNLYELKPMLYVLDDKFPPVVDKFDDFYRRLTPIKKDMLHYRFGLYKERIVKDKSNMPNITISEFKLHIEDAERFTIVNIRKRMEDYKSKRMAKIWDSYDAYESEFESLLQNMKMEMLNKGYSNKEINSFIRDYKSNIKVIQKHSKDKKLYLIQDILTMTTLMEKSTITKYLNSTDTKAFNNVKSIIKYPELKVLGEALGKILLGSRIECYNALAKELTYSNLLSLTNKKGLIFSNYVSVCKTVIERTIKEGYNPVGVYGDNVKDLTSTVKDFNNLDSPSNPIVATYKSLSTGVPLTSANVVILIDTALRSYLLEQAIARAWRIGNDEDVVVFMIKLDTGNKFNITERDLYIVNTSQMNVVDITGNEKSLDIPEQDIPLEIEENTEDEIIEEIEEEIEEGLTSFINIDMVKEFNINLNDESKHNLIKTLMKKIIFKK